MSWDSEDYSDFSKGSMVNRVFGEYGIIPQRRFGLSIYKVLQNWNSY